ncbi:MAG TPA: hypothetical protein VHG91_07245 [Longimicrobium sp.]|nr:hypothetical protein [Longimicrobium sp.]
MAKRTIPLADLAVESFDLGESPDIRVTGGSSGGGCTVLTTCSPECCDNPS